MAFSAGQKITTTIMNNPTPSGNMTVGGTAGITGILTSANNSRPGVPLLHAYQLNGATQNIANNTPTVITMTGELVDTLNGHSTVTNTGRYTPTVAGYYQLIGMVAMIGGAAGPFLANFWKNGNAAVESKYNTEHAVNQASLANTCMTESIYFLNGTTDFVELVVQHFFGATTATFANTANGGSYMNANWVAA